VPRPTDGFASDILTSVMRLLSDEQNSATALGRRNPEYGQGNILDMPRQAANSTVVPLFRMKRFNYFIVLKYHIRKQK